LNKISNKQFFRDWFTRFAFSTLLYRNENNLGPLDGIFRTNSQKVISGSL